MRVKVIRKKKCKQRHGVWFYQTFELNKKCIKKLHFTL